MFILVRCFAWLLAAAVTFATLGPPGLRPHADVGQDGEHALAFVLLGLAFGLAYPRRRLATAAIAVVLIGLLELMQFWAPGRHAALADYHRMIARDSAQNLIRNFQTGPDGRTDGAADHRADRATDVAARTRAACGAFGGRRLGKG